MKPLGWLRPFARDCWALAPDWRRVHLFMSNQALSLGTITLTVLIAIDASKSLLLTVLFLTAAMTLVGTLIEQPELEDGEE